MRRNSGAMGFEFFPRPLRPEVWERFRRRRKHEDLPQGKNIVTNRWSIGESVGATCARPPTHENGIEK
jgi:hypothetical protein